MSGYLVHYASPYYDPEKAHQYYEEHKQLKGRNGSKRSTSSLNEEGKKIWEVTKSNIDKQKKANNTAAQQAHQAEVKALQTKANATRENISRMIQQINDNLSKNLKATQDTLNKKAIQDKYNLEKKRDDAVDQLEKQKKLINKSNMSSNAKAIRLNSIDRKINQERENTASEKNKITNTNKSELTKVQNETTATRTKNSNDAKVQREQISAELKASVSAARTAYDSMKKNRDQEYENLYQAEYDKILSSYKKATSKKTAKSSGTGFVPKRWQN